MLPAEFNNKFVTSVFPVPEAHRDSVYIRIHTYIHHGYIVYVEGVARFLSHD